AVLDRLLGREEEVTVGVALDSRQGLTGVGRDQLVEHGADADDLPGVDVEVARLTLQSLAADQRLMHVDRRIGQRESFAFRAGHQDDGAKACRAADADGRDGRLHILHRVVDRQPGRDGATGGVDVDLDLLVGSVCSEVHELGDDEVGDDVIDRPADDDDPVLQQPRVDVKGSLAVATFVLYNGRDVRQCESELTRNFRGGSWPPPQAPSVACDVWAAFGGFGLGDGRNESGLDPHFVYVRG